MNSSIQVHLLIWTWTELYFLHLHFKLELNFNCFQSELELDWIYFSNEPNDLFSSQTRNSPHSIAYWNTFVYCHSFWNPTKKMEAEHRTQVHRWRILSSPKFVYSPSKFNNYKLEYSVALRKLPNRHVRELHHPYELHVRISRLEIK